MSATEICNLIDFDLIQFIHKIYLVIKIGVPIVLIILGMLDFLKSVAGSKEDEIKKGQQVFIKRLIAGFLVFFTFTIVQFIIGLIPGEDGGIMACAEMILNGTGGASYVDTNLNGSKDYSGAYSECVGKVSDISTCDSLFQDVYNVNKSNLKWESLGGYSEYSIPGVTCKFDDDDLSNVIKKQIYSCANSVKKNSYDDNAFDEAIGECLNNGYLSEHCSFKKSNSQGNGGSSTGNNNSNGGITLIKGVNGKTVGDEVAIGTEHFYVVFSDDKETYLLSKYNLLVGENCVGNDCHPIDESEEGYGIQNEKARGAKDGSNDTIGAISYCGGCSDDDISQKLYLRPYLDTYVAYLNNYGIKVVDSGLLTRYLAVELEEFSWLYNTSYWLADSYKMSSASYVNWDVWYVMQNGEIAYTPEFDWIRLFGLRPVIEVNTSDIK